MTVEADRLVAGRKAADEDADLPGDADLPWQLWGPYLSERQWGTVREDYSPHGTAWEYFPHDHARSRAYRWGEDGIAGLSDSQQRLCVSVALWNGVDPILKERLFGLSGDEGNHGEDVKECYYYLDNTPTHSYMRMLYKYPQNEFPYARLVAENRRRGRDEGEFELVDTGVFDDDRYFDVFVEVAKAAPEDLFLRITVHNRGPEPATLHLLPQVVFRNTWSWTDGAPRPSLEAHATHFLAWHDELGAYRVYADGTPRLLLTENETNVPRLFGASAVDDGRGDGAPGCFKDAFHDYIVEGRDDALATGGVGTKGGFHYELEIPPAGSHVRCLRLTREALDEPFDTCGDTFARRIDEANEFYEALDEGLDGKDEREVHRQAYAGLLWTKQWYHYDVERWLQGDPAQPPPPAERRDGRNRGWEHLNNADVLSMPDTWEFPWYAAWDLAFHCVAMAPIDARFAKRQLVLLTREWYMHPNGQLPAYEWALGDANPPVHAWAACRVFEIDAERTGKPDFAFLERVFHKLLLNFTWWVNRNDEHGDNLFHGGFLGLDNIGAIDRDAPLPDGGHIEQADATSWMAMYCLNMLRISLELATVNPVYEDVATKFFEHFLRIAGAMANVGGEGVNLWDERDQFFYDVLHYSHDDGSEVTVPMRVRSIVGLAPLFAVEVLEPDLLARVPGFRERLRWFLDNYPELASLVSRWHEPGVGDRRLLSILRAHRMKRVLTRMLDETEFLSDYGVRALSKYHEEHPYVLRLGGTEHRVAYEPGEGRSGLFGGNSNWRGPIWFPINYLLVRSLRRFHRYYGDDFLVECPTGSGHLITLDQVADELRRRLCRIFLRDDADRRPVFGECEKYQSDEHFRDYILFHEYFHGDTGRGVGASHQTGWTSLVATMLGRSR